MVVSSNTPLDSRLFRMETSNRATEGMVHRTEEVRAPRTRFKTIELLPHALSSAIRKFRSREKVPSALRPNPNQNARNRVSCRGKIEDDLGFLQPTAYICITCAMAQTKNRAVMAGKTKKRDCMERTVDAHVVDDNDALKRPVDRRLFYRERMHIFFW